MTTNCILPFINPYNSLGCGYPAIPAFHPVNIQPAVSVCSPETREAVYKAVDGLKQCLADYNYERLSLDSWGKEILFPKNPELAKNLNVIAQAFPEYLTTINKPDTHGSMLSIHLLKAFKNLIQDPDYDKLPDGEKRIVDFSVLLHDIAKLPAIVDPPHPGYSAVKAGEMMKRFGWSDKEAGRVSNLIRNHHWVGELETCQKSINDVANDFNNQPDFLLGIIMAKSDIKAGGSSKFINSFNDKYIGTGIIAKIQDRINSSQRAGNYYYYPPGINLN